MLLEETRSNRDRGFLQQSAQRPPPIALPQNFQPTPAAGSRAALRIPRGDGAYLYGECRRAIGYDQYTASTPVEYDGAVIRIAPDYGIDAEPQLVDATPFTNTVTCNNCGPDQTVKVGRGLFDPASKIYIKKVSADDTALQVSVTFNYQPAPPTANAGVGTRPCAGSPTSATATAALDIPVL